MITKTHITDVRLEEQKIQYPKIRITVLGDRGAGKTSIIKRFLTNKFSEMYDSCTYEQRYSTVLDLKSTELAFNLNLLDLTGQDYLRSYTKAHYSIQDAYLFVFDLHLL